MISQRLSFFAFLAAFLLALSLVPFTASAGGNGSCIDPNTGGFIDGCDNGPEVVIITMYANPTVITQGQSSTLSVSVNFSGNGTCTTNIPAGSGIGTNPSTGYDEYVVYPTVTTSYYYTCTAYTGASGSGGATVTVNPAYTDMYAAAVSGQSATVGQAVTFSSTVYNQGNSTATNFPNSFQISGVGYVAAQTHTLGAGGSAGISASYAFGSPGTYSVRACADTNTSGAGAYAESDEGNNCGAWGTFTVTQADLTAGATSYTADPSTPYVIAGQAFTFNSTVTNAGSATASNFPNMFWIDSVALFAANSLSLSPSQSAGISGSYTFNTPGTYNVQACADFNSSWGTTISESNESNNCGGWLGISVVPRAPTGFTASCNANGTAINFSWNASAGSSFYYVRVSAPQGTCPAGWQYVWGSTCIPNPDQWNSTSVTNFTVTPGVTYYYGAHGALSNGAWGPYAGSSVTCSGAPDLTASNLSPSGGTTYTAGSLVTFNGRINNAGNATASNIPNVFQVCDSGCSTLNTVVSGSAVTSLGAGASNSSVFGSYTFNTPGTYYYRTCADNNTSWVGANTESNESNNCDGWTSITINSLPDLTATTGGAANGTVGSPVTLTGTITNAGGSTAAAHSSVIQICGNGTDASCSTVQANNQVATGALAASASQIISTQYTFSTSGTNGYSYRVCADNWTPTVTESNDANNCGAWSYVSISDLAISASCSASPSSTGTNQNVTWTASASGGNGSFTYSWSGSSPLSGTGNPRIVSYSSTGTKTGSVTVTSGTSNTTVSCSNSVNVTTPPTVSLTADQSPVATGGSTTLRWSSTGATSCTGTGFSTGGATSGSASTGALSSTQNYQVSCTGTGGTTNAFATVTVVAPTATITAEPTLVKSGGGVNLKWSANDVSSCTITPYIGTAAQAPVFSGVPAAGTNTTAVTNITKQTDYQLDCTPLSGGNVRGSVQVNVRFDSDEF